MIFLGKTRKGKFCAVGTGQINSDPQYRVVGDKETPLCTFYINSDVVGKGTEKEYDSFLIQIWNDEAAFASNMEKGDKVFVFGECKRDEYHSKKSGKEELLINADFICPCAIGTHVLQLMQTMGNLAIDSEQDIASVDENGFSEYSAMDLPDEFKPSI